MRTLEPIYDHRFTIDEIRTSYTSPADMFNQGDFMLAAEFADPESELKASALILAGLLEQGLELFDRLTNPSAHTTLHAAFACWSLKQESRALQLLAEIAEGTPASAEARHLAQLIARQEIRVFLTAAFIPLFTDQSDSAREPEHRYGPFKVSHLATQVPKTAHPYELHQPLDEYIARLREDQKPDFFFAATPQWILPRGFEKVKIPKAIWCHDTDVFAYKTDESLALFDTKIVMISQEHFELSHILGSGCVSNIMSNSLCSPFPQAENVTRERDIDLLFSGAALDEFHSEKARFISQISELAPEHRICVVSGHLDEPDYYRLLERSKFLPIVNRYCGCPSPRWRDALCHGANLLYPRFTLYGQIVRGCQPFDNQSLVEGIKRHIHAYAAKEAEYDPALLYEDVARRFAIHQQSYDEIFLRLLKFVAFCTLVRHRAHSSHSREPRNRLVWLMPALDAHLFGQEAILNKVKTLAYATSPSSTWDDKDFNNAALLFRKLSATFPRPAGEKREWRARAETLLQDGIARFPRSLLLRFNLEHWRFHDSQGIDPQALVGFAEIIERFDELEFDPLGSDVGLGSQHGIDRIFPYYDYGQLVIEHKVRASRATLDHAPKLVEPSRVLLSAAHAYVGLAQIEAGNLVDGLAQFDTALGIFADNLPLLKLRFRVLQKQAVATQRSDVSNSNRLINAFFDCAEKWPAILLSDLDKVADAFMETQRTEELRLLLARWYRLASTVFYIDPAKQIENDLPRLCKLLAHYELFPADAKARMTAMSLEQLPSDSITQFDRFLFVAMLTKNHAMAHYKAAQLIIFGKKLDGRPFDPSAHEVDRFVEMRLKEMRALQATVKELRADLARIEASNSWRVTKPLRWLRSRLARLEASNYWRITKPLRWVRSRLA
jgi:hypothetical protein